MYRDLDDNELIYMIQENENYYEIMLEKYKPLILKNCKKYQGIAQQIGYEMEDLIQVANIALIEAIDAYKDSKDTMFYTFLNHCIKNKLKNELRDHQTNKKMALNKAISYNQIIPETNQALIESIPDKTVLDPFDYLLIEKKEIEYINFLNTLPFEVAVVYELKNLGFQTEEISKFLDIDEKTISKCLRLVRQRVTV